jgi:hypothetical protein
MGKPNFVVQALSIVSLMLIVQLSVAEGGSTSKPQLEVKDLSPELQQIYGETLKKELENSVKREKYERCKSAQAELSRTLEKFTESCGEFTDKTDCLAAAASCSESLREKREGGDSSSSSGLGLISQMLMPAFSQSMGAGAYSGNTLMSDLDESQCLPKGQKSKMGDMAKELYRDAKKSREQAQEAVDSAEKDADELTEKEADLAKDFSQAMRDMKTLNIELPANEAEARETAEKSAVEFRDQLFQKIAEQADVAKKVDLAQSGMTRLYPMHINPCLEKKASDKFGLDQEIQAMRAQYEIDLMQIFELDKREFEIKKAAMNLKFRTSSMVQKSNADFKTCLINAKASYQVAFDELKSQIEQGTLKLNQLKGDIEIAQKQLAAIPEKVALAIKQLRGAAENEREFTKQQLQSYQSTIIKSVNNYKSQLQSSQSRFQQAQYKFMQSEADYRKSQAVSEAVLGNVDVLNETYQIAKEQMCIECANGKNEPPGRKSIGKKVISSLNCPKGIYEDSDSKDGNQ